MKILKRLHTIWYRWWIKDASFKKSPTPVIEHQRNEMIEKAGYQ